MKWIIILKIIAFIGVLWLLIKGCLDTDEPTDGTVITHPDDEEEIFSEFENAENASLNSKVDEVLKIKSLRNKLKKIEEERENEN